MKKHYALLAGLMLTAGALSAQNNIQNLTEYPGKVVQQGVLTHVDQDYYQSLLKNNNVVDVWTDDFDDPAVWTVDNLGTPPADWVIGTAGPAGGFAIDPIVSTSGGNFAMFDSDGVGDGTTSQDAWIQNTDPIDLSASPEVLLTFESYYRPFQGIAFVEVSADGTNWETTEVHADLAVGVTSDNPALVSLNVSSTLGGSATAYVRFRYQGGWDYAWMVDDVKIVEQLANDLKLNYTIVSHLPEEGLEYGRLPMEQIQEMTIGAEFMNFGAADQNNCSVAMDMTDEAAASVFSYTSAGEVVSPGDTAYVQDTDGGVTWAMGDFTTAFTVTSDEETAGGDAFANNIGSRVFSVSNVYGVDGIGVYPNNSLTSLSTESFTGGEDLTLFSRYEITEDQEAFGVEIELNSANTDEGGIIYAGLISYDDVDQGIVNQTVWLAISDEYMVTAEDVTNGTVNILFDDTYDLIPGSYFAVIEMSSLGGNNNISVLDDTTVPQPNDASMIYLPGDQVYTNGNALAIRLMMDEDGTNPVGLADEAQVNLVGQNVPNPASVSTRIDFELLSAQAVSITVTDITGKVLMQENLGVRAAGLQQYMLDVTGLSAGNHIYTITTDQGAVSRKMTVIK